MENYIVSARKYRPQTFESVVGQQTLTQTLQNAIRQDRLAHAYLFCGPRGVGKTTCARIFAKTINCQNPQNGFDACNECESCRAFNEQRSFNIHELDAASNNGVEDIRALIEQVRIPPQIGKYSVYIIDEVHMLSQGAFNALLKTLEEPPAHAIFILATTEKHKVLPTILSRCQVYDFSRITIQDTIAHLQSVAQKEGITASEEALNVVAQKADGGMRDALSIFDQLVAFCGNEITYERTIEVLNVLDSDYYFRLVDMALEHNVAGALLLLNEVLNKGFDAGHFVTGFAQHLRDVLVSKDPQTLPLLETADTIRQRYGVQAQKCAPMWIFAALDIMNTCDINYRTARNKRLTVELALVKLCQLGVPQNIASTPVPQNNQNSQPAPKPVVSAVQQPAAPQQTAPQQATVQSAPSTPSTPSAAPQASMPKVSLPKVPGIGLGLGPKNKTAEPTNSSPAATPPEEEGNRPFTADRFRDAWIGLSRTHAEEPRLVQLLENYMPELTDEVTAEVQMPNPWQQQEMRKALPGLLAELRKELHNSQLNIQVTLAEYGEEQMAFTAEEKYKLMVESNPLLATLKETLDLQID
ncbi:MAG: DNA polymerase III subunit gamma/tau [Paludibacteraceae bacterium]|nr:DNA polymerase III subunit gamma/tau [Paludibacteraceae bacterium]